MLTVDFDRFPVGPADTVLDMGCGAGRHAFEVYRRGADVVALDLDAEELDQVAVMFEAMQAEGEAPAMASARTVVASAYDLPFPDSSFDRIIAAEVLEHLPDDQVAMAELARVLRPGGLLAVSVPKWLPEQICWALSSEYHEVEGGHVRIYRADQLRQRLESTGLSVTGTGHTHALHSPYWWLKCAVGTENNNWLVRQYHRLLVWDMVSTPFLTRTTERLLDPVIGKSVVTYLRKPEDSHAPQPA